MSVPISDPRPKIILENGVIKHDGKKCYLAMHAQLIRVGCSDITPEAAQFIYEEWHKRFGRPTREEILQVEDSKSA